MQPLRLLRPEIANNRKAKKALMELAGSHAAAHLAQRARLGIASRQACLGRHPSAMR